MRYVLLELKEPKDMLEGALLTRAGACVNAQVYNPKMGIGRAAGVPREPGRRQPALGARGAHGARHLLAPFHRDRLPPGAHCA